MNKIKGFTLIELLVVLAIVGVLITIILSSLSTMRNDAKIKSFKAEMTSLKPALVAACDTNTLSTTNPAELAGVTGHYGAGTINSQACGPSGAGTFNVRIIPAAGVLNCTNAIITQDGITYTNCQ